MHLASCLIFASLDDVNSVVWYGGGGVRRELERQRGREGIEQNTRIEIEERACSCARVRLDVCDMRSWLVQL